MNRIVYLRLVIERLQSKDGSARLTCACQELIYESSSLSLPACNLAAGLDTIIHGLQND